MKVDRGWGCVDGTGGESGRLRHRGPPRPEGSCGRADEGGAASAGLAGGAP